MDEVECSVCGKPSSRKRCRGVYLGHMGVQYVCYTCRKLPFDKVMDGLSKGKVYVRGTAYRNIEEMEKAIPR